MRASSPVRLPRSSAYLDDARSVLARGTGSAGRLRPARRDAGAGVGRGCALHRPRRQHVHRLLPRVRAAVPRPPAATRARCGVAHLAGDQVIAGGPHPLEAELARLIVETVPCAERVVLSTTGSEAVQVAIRIARAKTRRRTVAEVRRPLPRLDGPGAASTRSAPSRSPGRRRSSWCRRSRPGRPPGEVLVCPWNDAARSRRCWRASATRSPRDHGAGAVQLRHLPAGARLPRGMPRPLPRARRRPDLRRGR